MARLKGKRNASSSASHSEVNNAVEAAQAEAKAPSPMTVDENSTEVADNEENAVKKEVDEGVVAEAQEEDHIADKDKNGENANEITNDEENDIEVALNQETAVEEVVNGGNTADEQEVEVNCIDKEKNRDNMDAHKGEIEEFMVELEENNEQDAMEEKEIEETNEGNGVDGIEDKKDVVEEEKGAENSKEQHVGIPGENSEQQSTKSRKRIRKRKPVKRPAGVDGIEDKQDIVEEGKGAENSKEQHVGILGENSEQQSTKSRKRIRKRKPVKRPAGKTEFSGGKKFKIGENDTQQGDKIEEKDAASVGNKDKEKVALDGENGAENAKEINGKEVGESSKKRVIILNKGNKRNNNVAVGTSKNGGNPGTSNKKNAQKKAESMGMIFMCSSKTKQDCYRYKVLGLPAGKKNVVENIYKGMRLFLYDVDLKLLYGIYKASARGGYNIEPKAFNSQFPAQVRYQIIDDCLPLAEEKFRKVIKDNYYTRSKFNCQLNSEQVKNLCKLFVRTGRVSRSEKLSRSPRAETKKPDRGRRRRDEVRRPLLRDRSRQHERRRAGDSPVAPLLRHPPTAVGSSYSYERPMAMEVYRQEPRREAYRHEPPREVYRHEPPPREFYRHEPPPREFYRHEPPPREVYRLDPPVERRESYAESHLLGLQDALKRDPYTERRDSFRQKQIVDYRREPPLEQRNSIRSEPVMEHLDSYRRVPPLLEHSDSYRQERLLERRDLYGQDARLEHRDHQQLSLEPRRHNEMLNLEPRRQNEGLNLEPRQRQNEVLNLEPRQRQNEAENRYSDRVYSTFQPPEYHRGVDTAARGLSVVYRPTTTEAPPEYYPHDPFIGRSHQ